MAVVTALVPVAGRRVAVHVDGRCLCTVSLALLARWSLAEGDELTAADQERLLAEAAADAAAADALRLLERRARSRAEVAAALLRNGHAEAAAEAAVSRLTAAGLLDDADLARRYVADRRALSGWGELRIRQGLLALGVDRDVAEAALAAARNDDAADAELQRALQVLGRRGSPEGPPEAAQRRAYQALLRRGFPAAVAYAAVRIWSAEASGAES